MINKTESPKNQVTERPKNQVSVLRDFLNTKEVVGAINKVLPSYLTTDKMLSLALSEVRKTPKLLECDKISFSNAIVECAQLGLWPGTLLGQAYLVPYKDKCTLMPGYRGYIVLASRSGYSVTAHCVYENDIKYECILGSVERIIHIPADENRGKIKCVYAVAKSEIIDKKTGEVKIIQKIDHMTMDDLNKARRCSQCPDKFWDKWPEEMYRKTVVRRLSKYLDLSPEFMRLCDIDNSIDSGLTIDGEFLTENEQEKIQEPSIPQSKKILNQLKENNDRCLNEDTLL